MNKKLRANCCHCCLDRFPKGGPTYKRQVFKPRHQTPRGQTALNSFVEYPSQECKFDIEQFHGNVFNLIF